MILKVPQGQYTCVLHVSPFSEPMLTSDDDDDNKEDDDDYDDDDDVIVIVVVQWRWMVVKW